MHKIRIGASGAARLVATTLALTSLAPGLASAQAPWPFSGGGVLNTRAVNTLPGPNQLGVKTAPFLKTRWFFSTGASGGILQTPTAEPGGLYFGASNGYIYKLDPDTGSLIWSSYAGTYLPGITNPSTSKTSPAIYGNVVIVGIGGDVVAIDKMTGALAWKTQVNPSASAVVHASPVVVGGVVFTGNSCTDEVLAEIDPGFVPSCRGSVVALNVATGAIIWQTYMSPPIAGYSGAGVWGNSPVVDGRDGLVIVGTGNNYSIPASAGACVAAAAGNAAAENACMAAGDYVDSIVALDRASGAVVWSRPTVGADAFNDAAACALASDLLCTHNSPRDTDFASGANLFMESKFAGVGDDRGGASDGHILGIGQKNSIYWALNPKNGGLFWATRTASNAGAIMWGSTVDQSDHNDVYVALDVTGASPNNLVGRNGVPVNGWTGGAWAAIDAHTGAIVWQIASLGNDLAAPTSPGSAPGAMTYTNRVIFAGSTSGIMAALDQTGAVLWRFASGGSLQSAPAIFNETVYWGTGSPNFTGANQICGMYAFSAR